MYEFTKSPSVRPRKPGLHHTKDDDATHRIDKVKDDYLKYQFMYIYNEYELHNIKVKVIKAY